MHTEQQPQTADQNNDQTAAPNGDVKETVRKALDVFCTRARTRVEEAIEKGPLTTAKTLAELSDSFFEKAELIAAIGTMIALKRTDMGWGDLDSPVHGKKAATEPTAPADPVR
jgi:hypothetical protein